MEPKLCGKCCWPRCGEGAHSQRHSARGKRGRYDIAAETYRAGEPDIGKIAAGEGQLCLKPGMYYVRGVFFHVLTRRDVARGPPTWCSWDDWFPEHELPLE